MSNDIVAGIDIGTHSIKGLVVQRKLKSWEILSFAEIPSTGLRKGIVVDVEETSKNIQMIISGMEKDCNKKIKSAFVNIGGSHLYVTSSDGIISVSRADKIISKEDIERVLQAAKAINIPQNEEILDVYSKEFIIDDQRGIKKPEGLIGTRLEAKVLLLCYFQRNFTNLTQAVLGAKLQINDVIPSPIAAANAVLTNQQKELGSAVVDIGAATTSLVVYEEGEPIHLAIFPIGSVNITNDIAIGLRTEVSIAESIKKEHGTCIFGKIGNSKKNVKQQMDKKRIEVFEKSDELYFTKKQLVDIIEPRVSEILDLIQKELKKIGKQEQLPGGIVFSGGGAKISRLREFARNFLKLPCQIGTPKGIEGVQDDPSVATVVGLVLEGVDFDEQEDILIPIKGLWFKLKKWLKNFIP